MTREEVLSKVNDWIDEDCDDQQGRWHYGKIALKRDINRIYDSLDDNICMNCAYWLDEECELLRYQDFTSYCSLHTDFNFGCNKFKMKD